MKFLKRGSVKELLAVAEPQGENPGEGRFVFTDSYSVFDWGEMPDPISDKGTALCLIGAHFFEKLEAKGIRTHYLGLEEGGQLKRLKDLKAPSRVMGVKLLRVLEPSLEDGGYDYSVYRRERSNFLIPLEVIYRNALPEGSSVFRRLKEGSLSLEDLGLKEPPHPGQVLEEPILDVSTKLEPTDRYLTWSEAQELAALTDEEVSEIRRLTLEIDRVITEATRPLGLLNEDGKVEFGFDRGRRLLVVDVVGTPDECRFTAEGVPLSKELLRILYRRTPWYKKLQEAKGRDRLRWKEYISEPPPLSPRTVELVSWMYRALANELTSRIWFEGVPSLKEVIEELKAVLEEG
ncbi:MAG TPA: phosphoribosylaminoimidazolesuccinocarboxamide synthase [Deltaproteobacteria bacterium]|nr:phosphoribosylaminoimidazolesuccinocarboxamide synthase [Deltaproteobacteria bacterium]